MTLNPSIRYQMDIFDIQLLSKIVFLETTQITEKEARDGPFKDKK